jgi:hypothetical protein
LFGTLGEVSLVRGALGVELVVEDLFGLLGRRSGHLRPVKHHEANTSHHCLRAQLERGGEDSLERLFVTLAEPGDRRVVRKHFGANHPEGDVEVARTLDLAGRGTSTQ